MSVWLFRWLCQCLDSVSLVVQVVVSVSRQCLDSVSLVVQVVVSVSRQCRFGCSGGCVSV